jgi:thioredoxin 1
LDEPVFTLQSNKIKINMSKFKEIISSDKPTLVDFYATWCGPCQQMSPIFDRLKTKMSSEIRVVKIDVDKNQELVSKFKIRSVPTIILFRKGEIIWKYSGTMDQRNLEQKIKDSI